MKKICSNLVCVLKCCFLSCLFGTHPLVAQEYFSLKEAVVLGLRDSPTADRLVLEEKRLRLKTEKLEATQHKHRFSSTLLGSRNEVADSRDLEASAQETRQLNLSYQENFQNGAYWKINKTMRKTSPVDGDEEDTDFDKALLTLSYPLYGPASEKTRLSDERTALSIEQEYGARDYQKITLQIQIAQAFLDTVLGLERMHAAEQKQDWIRQKNVQQQKVSSQRTQLELRQGELELLEAEQDVLSQRAEFHYKQEQLALWIGPIALEKQPRLKMLPPFPFSAKELEQNYLANSYALQQLQKKIQLRKKELELSQASTKPDIALSGNIGESNLNGGFGRNFSAYISLSYAFGGGANEQVGVDRQGLEQLNSELYEKQAQLRLQARMDSLKLKSEHKTLNIRQKQTELAEQQDQLIEDSFKIGRVSYDAFIASKVNLLSKRLSMVQAQIAYWQRYLKALELQQQSLLSLLP